MTLDTEERKTAGITGLAKVVVQCSVATFVVNQNSVLRINICGENRHLRQARKRYWSEVKYPLMNVEASRNFK